VLGFGERDLGYQSLEYHLDPVERIDGELAQAGSEVVCSRRGLEHQHLAADLLVGSEVRRVDGFGGSSELIEGGDVFVLDFTRRILELVVVVVVAEEDGVGRGQLQLKGQ
jgi:hypothetical protein